MCSTCRRATWRLREVGAGAQGMVSDVTTLCMRVMRLQGAQVDQLMVADYDMWAPLPCTACFPRLCCECCMHACPICRVAFKTPGDTPRYAPRIISRKGVRRAWSMAYCHA